MPLNSWTCLFFFRFWFELPKKKDFTLLFISLVGTTHVSSTAASKACKITMEAMAGRIEQTARPGCTSYSLRSENHQLPSNSDWVEKHLKKTAKTYYSSSRRSRSQSEQPRCISSLAKKQPLKHKNDRPKKELFTSPKTKWRHTKRNYTLCIARILYPAIIIDRNHVNFQNDRPKN